MNFIEIAALSSSLTIFVLGLVALLARTALTTRITKALAHSFDVKLADVQREHKEWETRLNADLREREADIRALRDGALANANSRQALLNKRTFDAVDQLWAAYGSLTPLRMAANWSIHLRQEEMAAAVAKGDAGAKQFVDGMGKVDFKANLGPLAQQAKPYISPLAWAIFSAYQTIVLLGALRLHAVQLGIAIKKEWIREENVKELVLGVLPHYKGFLNEHGLEGAFFLLADFEEPLLVELRAMMSGQDQDLATIERSAFISKKAAEVMADMGKASAELGRPK